jgi:hypothetical protein
VAALMDDRLQVMGAHVPLRVTAADGLLQA